MLKYAGYVMFGVLAMWLALFIFGAHDTVTLRTAAEGVTVRPGDTLWTIARKHFEGDPRIAIEHIRKVNNLDSGIIHPGQWLSFGGVSNGTGQKSASNSNPSL